MLEQRVYEYLCLKDRGLSFVVPDTFEFARSDRPFAGRFVIPGVTPDNDPGLTFAEAAERTDVAWIPPSLSIATRKFSLKSMSSLRGHTVDIRTNRALMFESMLEFYMANILMAMPSIVDIEDQPAALKLELDGVEQDHTLDFRSTGFDGWKLGYQVKPADLLERDDTMRKVNALKSRHVPTFANDILVVTELQITRNRGLNAIDINNARKSRCQAGCHKVLDAVRGIGTPIKIWQLQERMGDHGLVWNAVLNLYYERKVTIHYPEGRITDDCLVRPRWRH